MNPRNKHWRRQKLVQKYITRLKKFPASSYGVITIINTGLYLTKLQVLHVVVGCVKVKDIIEEDLRKKLNLR